MQRPQQNNGATRCHDSSPPYATGRMSATHTAKPECCPCPLCGSQDAAADDESSWGPPGRHSIKRSNGGYSTNSSRSGTN